MEEKSESRERLLRGLMFVTTMAVLSVSANAAYAQNLSFLNLAASFIRGVIGHEVWGVGLGAFAVFELVMYGFTKNKLHLIGVIVPGLMCAAWVERNSIIANFAPGINL
jgi:hypothetical protein